MGDEPAIDRKPIGEVNPGAPTPNVEFPAEWRSEDATLNAFIQHALAVCSKGDYDGFRQLFGTANTPTGQSDFERVWYAVRDIRVAGLYRGPQEPPDYYLHAVVRYREPDRKGRQTRDVVVMLFREAGEWRLAPAPKEIVRKVLIASTRPASAPASDRIGWAGSRPGEDAPGQGDSP